MSRHRVVVAVATFGSVGLGLGGLTIGGAAAQADSFAGTCPDTTPAATLVADNVCEVVITTSGSFTPPPGIAKLSAILIGGGGGASNFGGDHYAGSGGSVVYVDSIPVGAALAVTVGAAGAPSTDPGGATDGGQTSVDGNDAAGGVRSNGGDPEELCRDSDLHFSSAGDGARTLASNNPCLPGSGFTLDQIPGLDPALFPASANGTESYGDGGADLEAVENAADPTAGDGGAAGPAVTFAGGAGLVILRFAPVADSAAPDPAAPAVSAGNAAAPTLASTGTDLSVAVPTLSFGFVVAGALLLALTRRRRARS